jgi:recombination protein RecR
MADEHLKSLERLEQALQNLPGIGPRSAERIAFHVLRQPKAEAAELAQAILGVKESVFHCSICYNLTENDPCAICRDPSRDQSQVWVVEQPKDVLALEATGLIRGVYHVLMGHIAPLEGVEPDDLTIESLIQRVKSGKIREVVLATNPTLEGDGTALHIQSALADLDVTVSRPARGLAVGSPLEYASPAMLESAIRGRTTL